jgi:hypothetical protein
VLTRRSVKRHGRASRSPGRADCEQDRLVC